jgi:hypothetical protein
VGAEHVLLDHALQQAIRVEIAETELFHCSHMQFVVLAALIGERVAEAAMERMPVAQLAVTLIAVQHLAAQQMQTTDAEAVLFAEVTLVLNAVHLAGLLADQTETVQQFVADALKHIMLRIPAVAVVDLVSTVRHAKTVDILQAQTTTTTIICV